MLRILDSSIVKYILQQGQDAVKRLHGHAIIAKEEGKSMDVFTLTGLISQNQESSRPYLEFLRVPSLSAGLYRLPAGGDDPQQPHAEDEVYYVVQGRATIRVQDEDRAVTAGSIVYVPARVPHRFHAITEDLQVLVFFAPSETTVAGS
jgi:mannose-6-phosphate isomerase-like protein (cupin superfamily)